MTTRKKPQPTEMGKALALIDSRIDALEDEIAEARERIVALKGTIEALRQLREGFVALQQRGGS